MSDPNNGQNVDDNLMNEIYFILGIIFGILNIMFGGLLAFINAYDYDSFDSSLYGVFFIEGILLIIISFIVFKKLNYKVLLFIPILVGIISIIIGSMYVYSRIISSDFSLVIKASEVIIVGMLLIIASFSIFKEIDYKKIILVSLLFVILNIIIESMYFNYLIKYYNNYYSERKMITSLQIIFQIIILIMYFIIITKKRDYKYFIFIPIIFGIKNIYFGAVQIYIKINLSPFYREDNDVVRLGLLIFVGILLIIFLFRIIKKLNNKFVLCITIPFGMLNLIYGIYKLIDTLNFYSIILSNLIVSLVIIAEGILLLIMSCKLSVICDNKEVKK